MALEAMIWQVPGHPRSRAVCQAMLTGLRRLGVHAGMKSSLTYRRPETRVGIFYGISGRLVRALADYPAEGRTAVHFDLGYWGRKEGGRFSGFHKLTINDRHPNNYFQRRAHDGSRLARFGVEIEPWRTDGRHIVVAAMGPKGSRAEGFNPYEWERRAIAELKKHTDRPIVFRPKPNHEHARPIEGTIFGHGEDLREALRGAHALVTHHSNAAIEALAAGVPAFVAEGPCLALGAEMADLSRIEEPPRPSGRKQFLADLAWCQWSISEIEEGLPWRHLKEEGLIP